MYDIPYEISILWSQPSLNLCVLNCDIFNLRVFTDVSLLPFSIVMVGNEYDPNREYKFDTQRNKVSRLEYLQGWIGLCL